MDVIYIFAIFACVSVYSLPVFEDRSPVELVNTYYQLYPREVHYPNVITKREIEPDIGSDESESSDEDDLYRAHTRRYYPYFRVRRIYRTRYSQPKYPLSNYADSYDRFPTLA
ncbi:uncharacterized protein LOC130894603 [Diorhabda carinulata]|uniref:uncharacterized protein LOC130894603 n=1 Tax=Diorhabda carinulata TaxID=1163345 RepID=UPI0025A2340C|nr:uncharacterized protein LOC130894603 [Diorhabda carinulata]